MIGYDAARMFLALNNHFFQPNYDYFRYHGGVSIKLETYDKKRPDEKYRYDRLAKKFQTSEELEHYIVSHLLNSKKRLWVGALSGGDADTVYLQWQGRTQSIQYNMINEVRRLVEDFGSFNCLFKFKDHQHPEILKSHLRGDLSLESFVLLDSCIDFVSNIDSTLSDDRNWTILKHKAVKYRPFLDRLNTNTTVLRKALADSIRGLGVIN